MDKRTKLSRRDFFKVSSALGATGALLAAGQEAAATPLHVPDSEYAREKGVPVLCQMCAQHCPATAWVKEGKVVRLEASRVHQNWGTCGRARAAVSALYSEDRIKTPLIRTGERGKGEFRKASWDEALDLVAGKMKALRDAGKADRAVLFSRFTSAAKYDELFFNVFGSPNIVGYGDTCFSVVSSSSRAILNFGGPGSHSSDFEHADYGLVIGKNLGGAIIAHGWGAQFGDGLRHGLPLTVVDPRHPNEMAQATAEWLPIRPGTDYSFLLGVIHFVFKKGYVDAGFLSKTNADALIDPETLLPLFEDEGDSPGDYLVFDTAENRVRPAREARVPAYGGTYAWEGKTVRPALALLQESALANSPEEMAAVCGISPETMESVADRLHAAAPKAFVEIGYRFTRHSTDFRAQVAIQMLNLLLGLYGQEGGIQRNRNAGLGGLPVDPPEPGGTSILAWHNTHDPGRWAASPVEGRSTVVKAFLEKKPMVPELLFFWGQDLVGGTAGGADVVKMMKEVETIVAVSPFWQDSVMFADVILPGCTFLEQDQPLYTGYKSLIPVIGVNRKAVDPVLGSRDGYRILCQLAKRVLEPEEYDAYFLHLEKEGLMPLWRSQFKGISGLTPDEAATLPDTVEALLEKGSWGGSRTMADHAPKSPTGKHEVYSFWLAGIHHRLATEHPDYGLRDHASPLFPHLTCRWYGKKKALGTDEFIPASGFSPLGSFCGGQTRNNPVLVPLHDDMGYANVFINEARARKLGVSEGDTVEVWLEDYPEERQRAVVSLSRTVHPDVLFYYHGFGRGCMQTPEKLRFARHDGLNINHFGRLQFSPGVAGHLPQDVILKLRRAS